MKFKKQNCSVPVGAVAYAPVCKDHQLPVAALRMKLWRVPQSVQNWASILWNLVDSVRLSN